MEFINILWPNVSGHQYVFLFIGMVIGGETFLLPAIYLAMRGTISLPAVVSISALATILSDSAWYAIGRSFPLENILTWRKFIHSREKYEKIFRGFKTHSQKFLFASKFVYGTRTILQILAGSIKMPFWNYSIVNLAGIMSYLMCIYVMALSVKRSMASFGEIPYNEYVSASIFICLILIFHLCIKKWLGKKFLASSSQPGTRSEL